jgi:hypothetical protein
MSSGRWPFMHGHQDRSAEGGYGIGPLALYAWSSRQERRRRVLNWAFGPLCMVIKTGVPKAGMELGRWPFMRGHQGRSAEGGNGIGPLALYAWSSRQERRRRVWNWAVGPLCVVIKAGAPKAGMELVLWPFMRGHQDRSAEGGNGIGPLALYAWSSRQERRRRVWN